MEIAHWYLMQRQPKHTNTNYVRVSADTPIGRKRARRSKTNPRQRGAGGVLAVCAEVHDVSYERPDLEISPLPSKRAPCVSDIRT